MTTELAAIARTLLEEQRELGRREGRIEAIREASSTIVHEIDRAFLEKDKPTKRRLELVQGRIERLALFPRPSLREKGDAS
jgi:hypothetical protein